jgi:NAD(P)-dependent dehydrogenase (short-subunit alcohol dehydrogenase family)
MKDLSNKKIGVFGGKGLLGGAIVYELSQQGAQVICIDVKDDKAGSEKFISFDITKLNLLKEFCGVLVNEEKIDGLVNASFARAKGWKKDPHQMEWDEWQANIDAQLNSVCLSALYTANDWVKNNKKGVLVNLSSIFGVVAPPMHLYDNEKTFPALPYPAIKGGLISFTTFLAAKFGRNGIRANCVSPGAVLGSPMQTADKFIDGMKNNMLGRLAEPAEIAKPVAFLLSENAAFITGQNLVVDGGWTNI